MNNFNKQIDFGFFFNIFADTDLGPIVPLKPGLPPGQKFFQNCRILAKLIKWQNSARKKSLLTAHPDFVLLFLKTGVRVVAFL